MPKKAFLVKIDLMVRVVADVPEDYDPNGHNGEGYDTDEAIALAAAAKAQKYAEDECYLFEGVASIEEDYDVPYNPEHDN